MENPFDLTDDFFVGLAFFSPNVDQGFGSGGIDGDISHGLEGVFRVLWGFAAHGFTCVFLAGLFRVTGFFNSSGRHSV